VLSVENVERSFGAARALAGVDLSIVRGELLTILGPSGSGKTTLLKAIAGFESLDRGTIAIDGVEVTRLPPARRDIGMVFQHYALFPHMKVYENVAFALKMRHRPNVEIAQRVNEALQLVELEGLAGRYPAQLSGGQQQRVALARAIVFNPKLLLLDEPFGALDRKLRETMQLEVRRLHQRLGLTTIFITHDQEEALIMSDRIAIMREGRMCQIGTPEEIYTCPRDEFVADFVGESNLIAGRIERILHGRGRIASTRDRFIAALVGPEFSEGQEVTVLLRPEVPWQVKTSSRPDNTFRGRIVEIVYLGNAVKYRITALDGTDLMVRWPVSAHSSMLALDSEIEVGWSADDGHVLPRP